MRILIVEDEPTLYKTLSEILEEFGYQVDIAENFADGLYFIDARNYNLIIINHLLPDGCGLDLIPIIKSSSSQTSIIITSSKANKILEIQSLKNGADDFIAKPIDLDILLARIDARLRSTSVSTITIADLSITPSEERIMYKGKTIDIKGKPFEVFTHLALNRDRIVSKSQLLDAIWEEPELVTPNVIEVAINQIRQKLDKPLKIKTLETIRRRGYRFCYPKNGK